MSLKKRVKILIKGIIAELKFLIKRTNEQRKKDNYYFDLLQKRTWLLKKTLKKG